MSEPDTETRVADYSLSAHWHTTQILSHGIHSTYAIKATNPQKNPTRRSEIPLRLQWKRWKELLHTSMCSVPI